MKGKDHFKGEIKAKDGKTDDLSNDLLTLSLIVRIAELKLFSVSDFEFHIYMRISAILNFKTGEKKCRIML